MFDAPSAHAHSNCCCNPFINQFRFIQSTPLQDDFRAKLDASNTQRLEIEARLDGLQQNANELRQQLDAARTEIAQLLTSTKLLESNALQCRNERNFAIEERDQILHASGRQQCAFDRLQADIKTLQSQLETAIAAKVEAAVRCDEIEAREHIVEQRERHMEQERELFQTQIASLTDNLHKSMKDAQTVRHENTMTRMQLEAEVAHKTGELKQTIARCTQYAETNQQLTAHAEELTEKLRDQGEESARMMEHYQKELQATNNLVDVYKSCSLDNEAEKNELMNAMAELKRHLVDITAQYGELETRLRDIDVEHERQLAAKDTVAEGLRNELANANQLMQAARAENVEQMLEQMSPAAAAASRTLKSGMSLTEIFTKYVQAMQDLQIKERESNQHQLQLKSIVAELEEQAPQWKRQAIDYQKVCASNEELQAQLEKFIAEQATLREEADKATTRMTICEREYAKLRESNNDQARQVCYLLKEIEQMRGGFMDDAADQSMGDHKTAGDVLSKTLVTFRDIIELQHNNQRLLLLVRDLSSKLEEFEEIQSNFNRVSYEDRLAKMTKRVEELEASAESQTRIVNNCTELKDRYKRLYYEIMRDVGGNTDPSMDEVSLNQCVLYKYLKLVL